MTAEPLEPRMLMSGDGIYHNARLPSDVDRDGWSTPRDVLLIVNELNTRGSRPLNATALSTFSGEAESPVSYELPNAYDVNNDGFLSPIDAVSAVTRINGGEGENGPIVRYTLRLYDSTGTTLIPNGTKVGVGTEMMLKAFVDDLRVNPPVSVPGALGAYLDVDYSEATVRITYDGTFVVRARGRYAPDPSEPTVTRRDLFPGDTIWLTDKNDVEKVFEFVDASNPVPSVPGRVPVPFNPEADDNSGIINSLVAAINGQTGPGFAVVAKRQDKFINLLNVHDSKDAFALKAGSPVPPDADPADLKYISSATILFGRVGHNNVVYGELAPSADLHKTTTDPEYGWIDHAGSSVVNNEPGIDEVLLWSTYFTATNPGPVFFLGEDTTSVANAVGLIGDPDPFDAGESPTYDTFIEDGSAIIVRPLCPAVNTKGNASFNCSGTMDFVSITQFAGIEVVLDIVAKDDPDPTNINTRYNVPEKAVDFPIDVMDNDQVFLPTPTTLPNLQTIGGGATVGVTQMGGTVRRGDPNNTPANLTDDVVLYTPPNATFNGHDSFTYVINNGAGATSSATARILVTPVNDPPRLLNVPALKNISEDPAAPLAIGEIRVEDPDADQPTPPGTTIPAGTGVKTTLTVSHGTLNAVPNGATVTPIAGGIEIRGTVANVNKALATVTYQPTLNYNGQDTLNVALDDLDNVGGPTPNPTGTTTINISAVNDPPENKLPPTQGTDDETELVMSGPSGNALSVIDVDAGSSPVAVSLALGSAADGTLSMTSTAGLTDVVLTPSSISFKGTVAAINTALAAGLKYRSPEPFEGIVNLTMTTNDQGNSGAEVPPNILTDVDVLQIEVVGAERPKALGDTATANENNPANPGSGNGIEIDVLKNDRPNVVDNVKAKLDLKSFTQPANGTVTLQDNGTPDTSDDKLKYVPNPYYFSTTGQPDTFTYTINDDSGLGADSTATVSVTVTPFNDEPTLTLPAGPLMTKEDAGRNGAPPLMIGGIAVADQAREEELGTGVRVTLGVLHGQLNAVPNGATVTPSGPGTIAIQGKATDVRKALGTLTYTPTADYYGADTLNVLVDDLNNVGPAGAPSKTKSDSVAIDVESVNDIPVVTVPPAQNGNNAFIAGQPNELSAARGNAIQVDDVEGDNVEVAITCGSGQLSAKDPAAVVEPIAGGIKLKGSLDNVNAWLRTGVIYRNNTTVELTDDIKTQATDANNGKSLQKTTSVQVIIFVPSDIKGAVFVDANQNGNLDAGEMPIAGVEIILSGTTFQSEKVTLTTWTNSKGEYSFTNVKPGTYNLKEMQPYGFQDGGEYFQDPITSSGNDTGQLMIDRNADGEFGGIHTVSNHFTELTLQSPFSAGLGLQLLTDKWGNPLYPNGVLLALDANGVNPWNLFWGTSWSSYTRVECQETSTGWQITCWHTNGTKYTKDLAKDSKQIQRVGGAGSNVVTILADPGQLGMPLAANYAAGGEGEAADPAAAYREGVDAVFAGYDESEASVA